MTTHFKNGVTNVVGKDGGSSVFSGIKQPLITGGYEQEQAYQNDFQSTMHQIGQLHQQVDLTFN